MLIARTKVGSEIRLEYDEENNEYKLRIVGIENTKVQGNWTKSEEIVITFTLDQLTTFVFNLGSVLMLGKPLFEVK